MGTGETPAPDMQLLTAFVRSMPMATLVMDPRGRILAVSAVAQDALPDGAGAGANLPDLLGQSSTPLWAHMQDVGPGAAAQRVSLPVAGSDRPFRLWPFAAMGGDAEPLWALQSVAEPAPPHDTPDLQARARRLEASLKFSEIRRARLESRAARLESAAARDALTGLFHSRAFRSLVSAELRDDAVRGALLYLDLNRFKSVNDTHGHRAGDAVLAEIARRMTDTLRRSDFVARMGGDEFAVWLQSQESVQEALVIERLDAAIRAPIRLPGPGPGTGPGPEIEVSAAIGVARAPDDGRDLEILLTLADGRMYDNKRGRQPGESGAG